MIILLDPKQLFQWASHMLRPFLFIYQPWLFFYPMIHTSGPQQAISAELPSCLEGSWFISQPWLFSLTHDYFFYAMIIFSMPWLPYWTSTSYLWWASLMFKPFLAHFSAMIILSNPWLFFLCHDYFFYTMIIFSMPFWSSRSYFWWASKMCQMQRAYIRRTDQCLSALCAMLKKITLWLFFL